MNETFTHSIDINEYDFSKKALHVISRNLWVKNQWPVVYFIKNDKDRIGYIGESTNALERITNHLNNKERAGFEKISIIGCDKFNKSATLEIESKLILYISSGNNFSLQNNNNGLSYHNYYQRALYGDIFEEIWKKLIEKKIVYKSLKEVENSEFFKYSPYKSLDNEQYNSVLEIIESLNQASTTHIVVKGSAGTGKTVLATYLIKLLSSRPAQVDAEDVEPVDKKEIDLLLDFHSTHPSPTIALVVPVTSLKITLQNVFSEIPGLNKSMVISPSETFNKKYDVLIVDEAHRLRQRKNISWMGAFTKNNNKLNLGDDGTELDWIMANSEKQIFFYDKAQSIKPSDVHQDHFERLVSNENTVQLELKTQWRVNAGLDYITFVDDLLNCRLQDKLKYTPENYELRVFESFAELYEELKKKEEHYKLCRLIAGYAWPWVTKDKNAEKKYDIEIEGLRFPWNRTDKNWIGSATSFEEVGCIHTTQGYDLNYSGIIFGHEITYNKRLNQIEIDPRKYYDRNGKAGITDPGKLKEYIINIYKTLMYRAIRGTYIYVCDKNLREYFKRFINDVHDKLPFKILDKAAVKPYVNCVPLFDIKVAAGDFSELQQSDNFEWIRLPSRYKTNPDYFVCRISGESMSRIIPNGSWCLFRKDMGGSREGKIVLVQYHKIQDPDFGAGFTIKEYHSEKVVGEDGWRHTTIKLKPLSHSPEFNEIILEEDNLKPLSVVGIFVDIITKN